MAKTRTIVMRSMTALLSFIMLATSGGLALAAANDYAARDRAPAGVTVSGVDVSGLGPAAVREAVEHTVVEPLVQKPLVITSGGTRFRIDPAEYVFVDVDGAVHEVYEPSRSSTIAVRALRIAAGIPITHEVEPDVSIDTDALTLAVKGYAQEVDYDPVDASISIEDGIVVITPAVDGLRVDTESAVERIAEALMHGETSVELPAEAIAPDVSDHDLGKSIVVRLASRTLELYEGVEVGRTYRVAVGKPGYSTPRGSWEITAKRYRPTWGNPGSAWAADMPPFIPPGPNNPLGTRAMNLNASGIRIHGTNAVGSIGRAASHGCIRMVRRDVEELYELVDIGTQVLIVTQ